MNKKFGFKALIVLMALALSLTVFAACGNGDEPSAAAGDDASQSSEDAVTDDVDAADADDDAAAGDDDADADTDDDDGDADADGDGVENVDVVGRWSLTGIEAAGITMDLNAYFDAMGVTEEDLEEMGISLDMFIEFDANGGMTLEFMGESETGEYEVNGSVVTISDAYDSYDCPVNGNTLAIVEDGVSMIFTKD